MQEHSLNPAPENFGSYVAEQAALRGMTPEQLTLVAIRYFTQKEYLTRGDAAEELSVSTRTVSTWLTQGLPHVKVGGSMRILRVDLKAWINRQRTSALDTRPLKRKKKQQVPSSRPEIAAHEITSEKTITQQPSIGTRRVTYAEWKEVLFIMKEIADAERVSVSDIIRRATRAYAAKHGARIKKKRLVK